MIRHLPFVCVLAVAPLFAQAQQQQATPPAQGPQPPAVANRPQPVAPPTPVAPDAPVVTVHGICPEGQKPPADKPDACTMVLTRAQFEGLVASINVNNTNYPPPALRGFATDYANILALASAGEKAGVEKDPRFADLMKIARARVLGGIISALSAGKIWKAIGRRDCGILPAERRKVWADEDRRIHVPKVDPTRPQDRKPEFEKKARELAASIRERAARGEDVTSLQVEVYKTLGLKAQPPQTELSTNPKPTFPANVEQDINALKAGEVTKVEFEPSGFNIYKVRSRNTIPIEQARAQIVREISQKNIDSALKAATGTVHSELNEQYFSFHNAAPPQRIPPRVVPPAGAKTAPPK